MFAKLTSLVSGASLPFTVGENKGAVWNWWSLYEGKMKQDGSSVSIFKAVIPVSDEAKLELARNSLKRLRGLKHPNIVSFRDSLESADRSNVTFYIVTEPVMTLAAFFSLDEMKGNGNSTEFLAWGLRAVVSGISFLTNECKLIYGSLCLNSVFVSHSLDWKLGIFDLLSEHGSLGKIHDPQPFMRGFSFVSSQYLPGEVHKKDWQALADAPEWAVDAWGLGCFIQEVFRGNAMTAVAELRELQAIPKVLTGDYQRLLSSQPQKRLNPAQLLERNSFFKTKLNDMLQFLESLILKDETERNRFFRGLKQVAPSLPSFLIQRKILPACLAAVEFGNVSSSALEAILDLLAYIQDDKYFESSVLPFLVKLLGSKDIFVRMTLLQSIHRFIEPLSTAMIESKFYPGMQHYFRDPDPRIRDQTIKSMSLLAPKMNQKTLNSSLLQHLAQLQRDPEAAIRTNTTVLLSKISVYLGEASCKRILLNAFTRVLNDPAPSVRNAAILALKETSQYYSEEDVARKLIPTMAPLVTDPNPSVSVNSFQCLERNFEILKSYAKKREEELASMEPPSSSSGATGNGVSNPVSAGNTTNMPPPGAAVDSFTPNEDAGDIFGDEGDGWGDDGLDDMLQEQESSGARGDGGLSSLNDTVNQQMNELMVGNQVSRSAPQGQRKHIAPPRTSRKPMKLGATKRVSKTNDDAWGDLLSG